MTLRYLRVVACLGFGLAACHKTQPATRPSGDYTENDFRLWPGGRIPYEFHSSFKAGEQQEIRKVMDLWQVASNVSFVPRAGTDKRYLLIRKGKCVTNPTMYDTPLEVSGDLECIGHELGHGIGLIHEHQRPDRDDYIVVHTPALRGKSQYEKLKRDDCLPYDLGSIMHYDNQRLWGKHGLEITRQDNVPSEADRKGVAEMYANKGVVKCADVAAADTAPRVPAKVPEEALATAAWRTEAVQNIRKLVRLPNMDDVVESMRRNDSTGFRKVEAFLTNPNVETVPPVATLTATQHLLVAQANRRLLDSKMTGPLTLRFNTEEAAEVRRVVSDVETSAAFSGPALPKPDAGPGIASGAAGLGGLAALPIQTRIIEGAADFFVTRAKDEMVYAFLHHIDESSTLKDALDAFVPSFMGVVRKLDATTPRNLVPVLRAAAIRDFEALPERVTDFNVYPVALQRQMNETNKDLIQGARLGVILTRRMRDGLPPITIAAQLADIEEASLSNRDVRAAIIAVGVLAGEYQATRGKIQQQLADPVNSAAYLATVVKKISEQPGFDPTWAPKLPASRLPTQAEVEARMKALNDYYVARRNQIVNVVATLTEIQKTVERFRDDLTKPTAPKADTYLAATRLAGQLLRSADPLLYDKTSAGLGAARSRITAYVELTVELQEAIAERDYTRAWTAVSPYISPALGNNGVFDDASKRTYRVMTLATALATASDAEAVTAAIEAAAAPVGSYRAKRVGDAGTHPRSFTLNGYVGVAGGAEWTTNRGRAAMQGGMSLPVGLEWTIGGLNFPNGKPDQNLWPIPARYIRSMGFFVPLVDLGNVANFRISDNENVEEVPEIGFSQIFAPGVFLTLGISEKAPFTLGFGGQYAPALRQRVSDGHRKSVVRTSILVGVDIPAWRF
jgi:hypothetical protein